MSTKNILKSHFPEMKSKEAEYFSNIFEDYRNSNGTSEGMLDAKNKRLENNRIKNEFRNNLIYVFTGSLLTLISSLIVNDSSKIEHLQQMTTLNKQDLILQSERLNYLQDTHYQLYQKNSELKNQVYLLNLKVDSLYLKIP